MMMSFYAVLFSQDVLDEIVDLIKSVSGVFLPTLLNSFRTSINLLQT